MKKLLIPLILYSGIASADTLQPQTDTFTASLYQESDGLTVQVQGQFTYNPTVNQGLVSASDLTAFTMTTNEYLAFNMDAPGYQTVSDSTDIDSFSFDPSSDLLTAAVVVIPNNPTSGVFRIAPNGPGEAQLGIDAPEVGSLGMAYGPAEDPPIYNGSVPEPTTWLLCGVGLSLVGLKRKASLRHDEVTRTADPAVVNSLTS